MSKYKLLWIDAYNLDNWGSIENLKEYYPITDYSIAEDNWADCNHCQDINAEDLTELSNKVIEYIEENGRNLDVFSVIDSENNIVLTEEDF